MIIVYFVKDSLTGEQIGPDYFDQQMAIDHCRRNVTQFPGEPCEVDFKEVDKLPQQNVRVIGGMIGFQFNKKSNGERIMKMTVYHVVADPTGVRYGYVKVLGRTCVVWHGATGKWEIHTELFGEERDHVTDALDQIEREGIPA